MRSAEANAKALQNLFLSDPGPWAIALSGGVDSVTLATIAGRAIKDRAGMFHAVSPAVPPEATARVRSLARQHDWKLTVFDAGEFENETYRSNPVNRCFYCKTSLYGAIRGQTDATIAAGTNLNDLGEYRPGLEAAREFGVRHPFVEAGISKAMVRELASWLGLGAIAELPAAPCLASRIETGIAIDPATLRVVDAVEQWLRKKIPVVRCRVRAGAVVIELDATHFRALTPEDSAEIKQFVAKRFAGIGVRLPVELAEYRVGSAFLRKTA